MPSAPRLPSPYRFKSHDHVTERRDLAFSNPPRLVPQVVGHEARLTPAIARAALSDHLHVTHASETALEMFIERSVVFGHDDEHPGIRK